MMVVVLFCFFLYVCFVLFVLGEKHRLIMQPRLTLNSLLAQVDLQLAIVPPFLARITCLRATTPSIFGFKGQMIKYLH